MSESKRIELIRVNAGLTRDEFSEHIGVSVDFVGKLERGEKKASRAILEKIVEVFPGLTIDYIIYGRLPNDPKKNGGNKSFLDYEGSCETPLAREMFRNMKKLANGIHTFDKIAVNYKNLQNLKNNARELSVGPELKRVLKEVQNDKGIPA